MYKRAILLKLAKMKLKKYLLIKQAMIATPGSTGSMVPNFSNPDKSGLISSLDYNPATGGSYSQERRLNAPFNLPLQPFQQQPQAPGQAQKPLTYEQFATANPELSTKDNRSFLHKAVTWLGGPTTVNMGYNSDLTNAYTDYQKQFYQNQLKQQGYQPQGQQQTPQGVDPNQWQQFQQWQQMMQQFQQQQQQYNSPEAKQQRLREMTMM